jgi:hypothetical protein
MSFWGKLAKIGLIGAAPFTGGASLAGLPLVDPIDNGISAIVDKSKGMPQVGVDANGNPVNAPTNQANANEAQALINNRAKQATIDQGGPAADRLAMQNQFRAGLAARMGANPIQLPGLRLANGQMIASPDLTPTTAGTDFANLFQQKMADRIKNGQSLTLSGVPAPSQEEIDANKKALDAAGVGTGLNSKLTTVGNAINQGVGYLQYGKKFADLFKNGGQPQNPMLTGPTTGPSTAFVAPTTDYTDTGDNSNNDMFGDQ